MQTRLGKACSPLQRIKSAYKDIETFTRQERLCGASDWYSQGITRRREIVFTYLVHLKDFAWDLATEDRKKMVAAGNLVLDGLTEEAWSEILKGKTLAKLRTARDHFQKAVDDLEEPQRLVQEEVAKKQEEEAKKRREQEAMLERVQLLRQQLLEATANNKRLREEDDTVDNDSQIIKRPRPEDLHDVDSLQQAIAAEEEAEREALLAKAVRQKEELKKIKLEPED